MPDSGFIFSPGQQLTTDDLAALNGGSIEVYEAGTTTPKAVYSDRALTASLGSIVYLDSSGNPVASQGSSTKVMVYTGAALVKLVVKTSAGVTVRTIDNLKCTEDTSLFSSGSGSGIEGVVSKTTDYSVVLADDGLWVECDPTGGVFTITLPSAATVGDGFAVGLRHSGTTTTNAVKIQTVSGQTISRDNITTTADAMTGGGEAMWLVSNGAGWRVISYVPPRLSLPMPLAITDRLTAPPASPNSGALYIINGTPTGDWSSHAQHDVMRANGQGGWIRYRPTTDCGWIAYVQDENRYTAFIDSAWSDQTGMAAAQSSTLQTATFQDQKSNGTDGGTNTAASWTARTLNTQVSNTITGCSLGASNDITLAAGDYLVIAHAPFFGVDDVRMRFKSTTTATAIYGHISQATTTNIPCDASLVGRLTLSAQEIFKLEYLAATAKATNGLGTKSTTGTEVEIYAEVTIISLTALQGAQGSQGAQGNTGPGYAATATTSLAIGSGSKAFTTQTGLAYAAGARARAASAANPDTHYMEGVVASYSGGTLTITVDRTAGSGSRADWNINLAGDVGAAGTNGTNGTNGADGAAGPTGASSPIIVDYTLDISSTADADPGAGKWRPNHATPASVTQFYVDDVDRLGNSMAAEIATWDDSTSSGVKGKLYAFDPTTQRRWVYDLTAVTAATGYSKLTVTHRAGALAFAANDVALAFIPKGDAGADGAGTGDVSAAAAFANDNRLIRSDGTAKGVQASGITVDDSSNVSGVGTLESGAQTITSASTTALAVGANGTTNPVLQADASTASAATGLKVTGAAATDRVAVSVVSSGTNEGLSIDAKGTGTIRFGATSTGAIEFSRNATPSQGATVALGSTTRMWANLFLASASVVNFNNGDFTVTHSTGLLAFSGSISLPNTGLRLLDTNASHSLIIAPGSDLTADRTLTVTTGDAARTVTINGNPTLNDWFDQSVKTTASPQFAAIELGAASDTTISRTGAGAIAVEGVGVALNSTSLAHTASTLELGHASDTTLSRSAAGEVAIEGTLVKKVGKETIWIPAAAMTARTTNGAASGTTELTTNDVMLSSFDFDTTTEEGVGFWVAFPKSWNEGTVTFKAHWTAASGSGGVAFGLAAYAFSDDDAMDTAVSGQQVVTDTLITANDMHVTAESAAITIGGTPAVDDAVYFEVTREVANGSDTLAVDAKLLGIRLFYTSDASTDA